MTFIPTYHVFPEFSNGLIIETLQGGTVEVSVGEDGIFFNDAEAMEVGILASNGVVHKIDTVLNPTAGGMALGAFVVDNPDLSNLAASLVRARLVGGPFPLFAPNNDAFVALPLTYWTLSRQTTSTFPTS